MVLIPPPRPSAGKEDIDRFARLKDKLKKLSKVVLSLFNGIEAKKKD